MKRLVVLLVILLIVAFSWNYISKSIPNLDKFTPQINEKVKVSSEESLIINVVKDVSPSVVTVGIEGVPTSKSIPNLEPFGFFFDEPQVPAPDKDPQESYIGSGFVIKSDGLIVTNRHVVADSDYKYIIVDQKGNKYNVTNIYRDPLNDLAILKVANPPSGGFNEAELGDSGRLQVGQMAIAIGTALGEFRNTVTTGVISGLGRGITADNPFEGLSERLDDVIQTDAAINPGNSGGPLLNSAGQVIGVNSAVSAKGQNIGFAIPINIVKDSLKNFNQTGQFNRPFLGVSYRMISRQAAIANELPEGAYVQEVLPDSPAEKAGIKAGDIITRIGNDKTQDGQEGLAAIIAKKKVGDNVKITINRDGKTLALTATLAPAPGASE